MHADTTRLLAELSDVTRRGRELVDRTHDDALYRRPLEGSWSAAECLEHLSVSTDKYVRRISRALETAERKPAGNGSRHSLLGRFFLWVMEPPVKKKFPVPPPFAPQGAPPRNDLVAHFVEAHDALAALVRETDAIDRTSVRVASPGSKYIRLSILDAFAILASHGRRHLVQAERAAGTHHV